MKSLLVLPILFVAGACIAADTTYKWVDEKGVVNYGEKPAQNRPAAPVNTNTGVIIEGGGQFNRQAEPAKSPVDVPQGVQLTQAQVGASARGMEFDVFIRLQTGMTEGELLLRAGPPDHQGVENLVYDIQKSYYYFPTTANPYTTVVTLRGGRIASLERIKKF